VLPPLGVFLERGCGADLLINLLLTILGCKYTPLAASPTSQPFSSKLTPPLPDIPGIIHALYIILKY
jgi:uncharacterized membrane protein YqaE (UPF0057 family)